MIFRNKLFFLLLLVLAARHSFAGGDEVVVVYNSNLPASKKVAEHYAAARAIPAGQVFGLALPTNEVMSRLEFTALLQNPLAEKLATTGLWKFGLVTLPATTNRPAHSVERVIASKIRYAVLCYGVPLKVAESSAVEAIAEKITRSELRSNAAAVDSELTWLPLLKTKPPLAGFLPNELYGCTNRLLLTPQNGILLVARLDGPTPEIAAGLVDKALAAERDGLWGRAYVDARGLHTNDTYYLGDAWMLHGADSCRQFGFETELDTNAATLPADYVMSHIAIYAGWYASDVCGPFKQPKVEFMPGAFAYHLYSYSAQSLRTASNFWCGPLLAQGATCTMGCVYEPYLQFTPNIALFLDAFFSGYTFGEAAWVAQNTLSWQNTVIGDPLYQPFQQTPAALHAHLKQTKNPLLEWSLDRLACVNLARGVREAQIVRLLEQFPESSQSAVLTEKLAGLYAALGKPNSALDAWQQALRLQPSPQQRLRLRLHLADALVAQGRRAEASEDLRQLLLEAPDYPGKPAIEEKLKTLAVPPATSSTK